MTKQNSNLPTINSVGKSQFPNNVDAELQEILDRLRVIESKLSCKYDTSTDPKTPENIAGTVRSMKNNIIALWYYNEALGVGVEISKDGTL